MMFYITFLTVHGVFSMYRSVCCKYTVCFERVKGSSPAEYYGGKHSYIIIIAILTSFTVYVFHLIASAAFTLLHDAIYRFCRSTQGKHQTLKNAVLQQIHWGVKIGGDFVFGTWCYDKNERCACKEYIVLHVIHLALCYLHGWEYTVGVKYYITHSKDTEALSVLMTFLILSCFSFLI